VGGKVKRRKGGVRGRLSSPLILHCKKTSLSLSSYYWSPVNRVFTYIFFGFGREQEDLAEMSRRERSTN
jgi:hypothetical protein